MYYVYYAVCCECKILLSFFFYLKLICSIQGYKIQVQPCLLYARYFNIFYRYLLVFDLHFIWKLFFLNSGI